MKVALGSIGPAILVLIFGAAIGAMSDDKEPKVIPSAKAKEHIDERCTVEMTVKASKNSEKRRTYFLDSEEDYRNPNDLAVIIAYDDAEKFKKEGIADPAEHYKDKTIRVTGKVIAEDDQVRIHVTDPSQIKVVEPAKP